MSVLSCGFTTAELGLLGAAVAGFAAVFSRGRPEPVVQPVQHILECSCDSELRLILELRENLWWWRVVAAITTAACVLALCAVACCTRGCIPIPCCLFGCRRGRTEETRRQLPPPVSEVPYTYRLLELKQPSSPSTPLTPLRLQDVAAPDLAAARARARSLYE